MSSYGSPDSDDLAEGKGLVGPVATKDLRLDSKGARLDPQLAEVQANFRSSCVMGFVQC